MNLLSPLWVITYASVIFFAFMVTMMIWESRGEKRIKDRRKEEDGHRSKAA